MPTLRLRPYRACKDSDVQWLGQIPRHWDVKPLKHLARFFGGGTPAKENADYWAGDIPWVSPKDMKSSAIHDAEDHITEAAVGASATRLILTGAVLVVVRSGILQHSIPVATNTRPVALNQDMKALVPRGDLLAEYVRYLISGANRAFLFLWRKEGATVESLEHELIAGTKVPVPSLGEQKAIVDFLDRETAQIDALLGKKRRLIEVLQEKRAARTARLVIEGLDPTVEKKDSGIPWFGRIPAHWVVKRLKWVSPSLGVGVVVNPSQYVAAEGVPFLYGSDIAEGQISTDNARRISPGSSRLLAKSMLQHGDLVTVRVGSPGITAVVPRELEGSNCASVLITRRGRNFDSDWLCYVMNSHPFRAQIEIVQYGAAQEQFNVSHAVDFMLPCLQSKSSGQ